MSIHYIPPPTTLPPGSLVDAYLRDSGGEKQDRSVQSQLVEMQKYCQTHQLILRHIYKDTRSGKSIVGREAFERMLDDVQISPEKPQGILLWDYARFARNAKEAIFHIALIEQLDIVVHSLTDDIPDGEFKDLIRYIKHLGNEAERKKNSAAVKRELRQLLLTTGAMFGDPPRGIKRTPLPPVLNPRTGKMRELHRWDPDPDWIPRIQKAFQMKAAKKPLAEIHETCRLFKGISTYNQFFANKIYIGILEYADLTIEKYCEPIVDRSTWETVQYIQKLHAHHANLTAGNLLHPRRNTATANYLLSGIAVCARCEAPLYGLSAKQRNGTYYYRYACTAAKNNRTCDLQPVPAKPLEDTVIENLTAFFEDSGNLADLLEEDRKQIEEQAATGKEQIKDLNKQLRLVRKSITNITETIADLGTKKSKALTNKLETLELEETRILTDIESVKTNTPQPEPPFTPSEITFLSKRLVTRLKTYDRNILKSILRGCINKVTVNRTNQHIFGTIAIHSPREPESEESPARITVSTIHRPMGAPLHRRSIPFKIAVNRRGRKKKNLLS